MTKFKQISVAYQVLSDQTNKARYDRGEDISQQTCKRESSWEKEIRKFYEKVDKLGKAIHKLEKRELKTEAKMNQVEILNKIHNVYYRKYFELSREQAGKLPKGI